MVCLKVVVSFKNAYLKLWRENINPATVFAKQFSQGMCILERALFSTRAVGLLYCIRPTLDMSGGFSCQLFALSVEFAGQAGY